MVKLMTQSQRKKQREKAVKENSSNFVEQFSKHCHQTGILEGKITSSLSSRLYVENYDKIDWSK
jgi:hypothetical protein